MAAKKALEFEIRATGGQQTISQLKQLGGSLDEVARKSKQLGSGSVDARSIARMSGMSEDGVKRFILGSGSGSGGGSGGGSAGGSGSGNVGTIKTLKGAFGEESAFGNSMKVLAGAGAVAGLAMAGRLLADATGRAKELAEQFQRGEISTGEMVENLAKSLPIIGGFVEAGRNIREIVAGMMGIETDAAAAARIKRETAAQDAVTNYQAASLKQRKQDAIEAQKQNAALAARRAVTGLEGYELDTEQQRQALNQKTTDIDAKLTGDNTATDERTKAAVDALRKQYTGADGLIKYASDAERTLVNERIKQIREAGEKEKAERTKQAKAAISAETDIASKESDAKYAKLLEQTNRWTDQLMTEEARLRSDGNRAMLSVMDRGFEAEIQQMNEQAAERKRVFKQQLDEQLKTIPPAMREMAKARGNAVMNAMDQSSQQQQQAKFQQTLQQNTLATYDRLAAAGDKFAKAEKDRLENAKRLREEYARLDAIIGDPSLTAEQRKQLEIEKQRQEQIAKSAASEQQKTAAQQRANELTQKLGSAATPAQRAEAQRQRDEIAAREQKIIDWQLRNHRQYMLQQMGNLPGYAGEQAKIAAQKQSALDELYGSMADVQSVLTNPAVTADQKRAAIQMLQQLAGTAGQRFGGQLDYAPQMQLVSADNSLMMSGIADRFASDNDPMKRLEQQTKIQTDLQKQANEMLAQWLGQMGPVLQQLGITLADAQQR